MTFTRVLLVFTLINAAAAASTCEDPRIILQNGTFDRDLPYVKANLDIESAVSAEECIEKYVASNDIVETFKQWEGVYACFVYNLNPAGANRGVYHLAQTCGDNVPKWIDNSSFSLIDYEALPRRGPGFYSEDTGVSFNGLDDSFSIGNKAGACSVNLDECGDGVVYSFWWRDIHGYNSYSRRYVFTSGAHLWYSQGAAFYVRNGEYYWNFQSGSKGWWLKSKFVLFRWVHLIATWSASKGITIYENGIETVSDADIVANNDGYPYSVGEKTGENNDFVFGRANEKEDSDQNGEFTIDDFRIYYNRVIDASEAKSLFLHSYSSKPTVDDTNIV